MECIVGCDQSVFDNPPKIGSIITVKHNSLYNNGTLRHPFYWRERSDTKWNDISQESKRMMVCIY